MTDPTTTNAGIPVESDEHSLTQGDYGSIVLHDHYLIEKMAQFNRERVPERVVHAKGAGAFGELEITGDVSAYTKAGLFQPGAKTEMLARFSTVAGEQGSPDTWRDPRGFALKFYTDEGNYDMVGNDTPIFFVRDPMKFQDFIRSQKRRNDNGMRDNNMQWDFWSLSPETAHQVMWLMGDRGIPKTYRNMDGFSSHTYQWINADGDRFWVRYHFKTMQGIDFFTQDEADQMAGQNPDFHRQDLWDSIAGGDHPKWSFEVQIMPFEEAWDYRFNPFDLTKIISQKDYPRIKVGTMTLNRNPQNYFAQIEQAAFEPSNVVPGVFFSPDKMLLGRVFSYADTHRYRIGTNYTQLPVNAPKSPVHTYSKDGSMRYDWGDEAAAPYAPNSYGGPAADTARITDGKGWASAGEQIRSPYDLHPEDDDFGQAHTLVRDVMDDEARGRLISNIAGHLADGVSDEVLANVWTYLGNIDIEMAKAVEAELADLKNGS